MYQLYHDCEPLDAPSTAKEAAADDYLGHAPPSALDSDYPCYSESELAARERRRGVEQWGVGLEPVAPADLCDLLWRECLSAAIRMGLTERQIKVMRWRREGFSARLIAEVEGIEESAVWGDLHEIRRRLLPLWDLGLYSLLRRLFPPLRSWLSPLVVDPSRLQQ